MAFSFAEGHRVIRLESACSYRISSVFLLYCSCELHGLTHANYCTHMSTPTKQIDIALTPPVLTGQCDAPAWVSSIVYTVLALPTIRPTAAATIGKHLPGHDPENLHKILYCDTASEGYREKHSASWCTHDISRQRICWWLIKHFSVMGPESYRIRRNNAK